MKKVLLLCVILIGASGCAGATVNGSEQIAAEANKKAVNLYIKELEEREIDLINPLKQEVLMTIRKSDFADSEETLREWVKELARGPNGFDQRMKAAKVRDDGTFVPGVPQVVLKEEELVEKIKQASYFTRQLEIPIEVTYINVTEEDVAGLDEVEIGRYATKFTSSISGRVDNIELSAKSIYGVVLGPGDIFSFNRIVGERTKARGYKEANVIVDGDFVNGLGGGICQTSTTLYNVALDAGMEIIERNPHSLPVSYVPEGRDAMVNWGTSDLRFRNSFDYPVLIQMKVDREKSELIAIIKTAQRYL
ncbi:VanW family protein [Alkalihalobacillus oceani]|uniref:VanW family protein n=1 Tax=Halalkalibacter oceani TaxID=1653776 RepID=A0A9X2DMM8_9BACI|nr:VanW family protein [Halalkalibacter oceani]MCM3713619.1 VanW family protein [Halalkalibacter oceani]